MGLIRLNMDTLPVGLKIPAMKKTDPDSSTVWRAVQAWKNGTYI